MARIYALLAVSSLLFNISACSFDPNPHRGVDRNSTIKLEYQFKDKVKGCETGYQRFENLESLCRLWYRGIEKFFCSCLVPQYPPRHKHPKRALFPHQSRQLQKSKLAQCPLWALRTFSHSFLPVRPAQQYGTGRSLRRETH